MDTKTALANAADLLKKLTAAAGTPAAEMTKVASMAENVSTLLLASKPRLALQALSDLYEVLDAVAEEVNDLVTIEDYENRGDDFKENEPV